MFDYNLNFHVFQVHYKPWRIQLPKQMKQNKITANKIAERDISNLSLFV